VNWKSAKTFQLAKLIYRAFKMKLGCRQTAPVLLFAVSHKLHQDCRKQKTKTQLLQTPTWWRHICQKKTYAERI